MTQQARNRRKGAEWEITLLKRLREEGYKVERLRLAGKDDEGDLVIATDGTARTRVIEAKNAAAFEPAGFMNEAIAEAQNYAKHRGLADMEVTPIVIVKRRAHGWKDAYVLTTVREYFGLP